MQTTDTIIRPTIIISNRLRGNCQCMNMYHSHKHQFDDTLGWFNKFRKHLQVYMWGRYRCNIVQVERNFNLIFRSDVFKSLDNKSFLSLLQYWYEWSTTISGLIQDWYEVNTKNESLSHTTFSSIPTLLLTQKHNLPFETLLWDLTFVPDKFIQRFVLHAAFIPVY